MFLSAVNVEKAWDVHSLHWISLVFHSSPSTETVAWMCPAQSMARYRVDSTCGIHLTAVLCQCSCEIVVCF